MRNKLAPRPVQFPAAWLGLTLLLATLHPVRGAETGPQLAVELRVQPDRVHVDQVVQIVLSIRTRNVRLGQNVNIDGLFDDPRIEALDDFKEHAPERRVAHMELEETLRFVRHAHVREPGELLLEPVVRLVRLERRGTPARAQWVRRPVHAAVEPVRLTVHPLPADEPQGFSGAVGQFEFDVEPSQTRVVPGDVIALDIRLRGEGVFARIDPPRLTRATAPGFRVYEPEIVDQDPLRRLRLKQMIVPRAADATEIPALVFSYFDPATETYRTLQRGPFPLQFEEPDPEKRPPLFRPGPAEDIEPTEPEPTGRDRLRRFWLGLRGQRTARTRHDESARLVPASGAPITFHVPQNALLIVLESHNGWLKIERQNNRGWIPAEAIAP